MTIFLMGVELWWPGLALAGVNILVLWHWHGASVADTGKCARLTWARHKS